jgi:hypothetical protein
MTDFAERIQILWQHKDIRILSLMFLLLGGLIGSTILYIILSNVGGLPIHIDCKTAMIMCNNINTIG